MIQLILGRAGYGKTEYVFSSIKRLVENGADNIILITPEQYSFVAERRLLSDLGVSRIQCVQSLSFSRLASQIADNCDGNALPVLSKGAKAVLMRKAISDVADELNLFGDNYDTNSFINSVIKIYDEMKSCRVTTQDIIDASQNTDRELLSQKLRDISLIIDSYDSLIKEKYNDPANELTRVYHSLLNQDFFKDKYVFIDGFSGFVAQEYKIIEVIIRQSKELFITFCTDDTANADRYSLFSYVNSNIDILRGVAAKAGVDFRLPIILDVAKRFGNNELKAVEKYTFSNMNSDFDGDVNSVRLYSAKNISDECDYVGMKISALLRQGYHAKDIAIICRDMDKYKFDLESAFRRYNIPFFDDQRQDISSQPIIMFVNFLLRTIIFSFRSDDIFSMLKTGLTALDNDNINTIENYAFLWNINGSKWTQPFALSTKGFVDNITDNDRKQLEKINATREYIVDRLTKFKVSVKGKICRDIAKALYYTLLSFSADKKLKELAISLDKNGKSALADEQGRVWDMLMEVLNMLVVIAGDEKMNLREFYKLFHLMISNEDLGTLPAGLDNVQLGSADRMRCDNPLVSFVLGANEGVFPQSVTSSGLLTESDRSDLIDHNFKLYSYGETLNAQEKYFAYMAVSSAKELLYVSYLGDRTNVPSSIIDGIKNALPDIKTDYYTDNLTIDNIESRENAFDILASSYTENSVIINSLKEYFSDDKEYRNRIKAVDRLVSNDSLAITNAELSTRLFKKDMYLSASRIEDYYNCPFRYFCKFGLGARPRTKAELDPMQKGTVIHYVLEQILYDKKTQGLVALTDDEITNLVNLHLSDFLNTKMGDSDEFTARFKYQFLQLSRMLVCVVQRLREEFSNSDFEAKAFELKIGNGSDNEPVRSKHIDLDDGGSIEIRGAIDRVDTYTQNGKTYVRVVDYKSGDKKFALSDILNGINLQMFIYLFTLCESDSELSGISSGVLYMHSARSIFNLDRNSDADTVKKSENSSFKMKGLILNDENNEVAIHMEHDLAGKYIPAKLTKKSGLKGDIATLEELGILSAKIDELVAQMGTDLHSGRINPHPINGKNHDKTCEHCDYADVCKNLREIEPRDMVEADNSSVMKILKGDDSDA